MTISKQQLRERFRKARRLIPRDRLDSLSRRASEHLLQTDIVRPGLRIALYVANDHEADPCWLEKPLREKDCQLYLPMLDRENKGSMRFAPWRTGDVLATNCFGIPEPQVPWENCVLAADLDIVIMPLVAYSNTGIRLGMGGGFYDRALTGCDDKPLRIGFAFAMQHCSQIPSDPWDQPLHAVVTEEGCTFISNA